MTEESPSSISMLSYGHHLGELHTLRIIAEDLEFWGVITNDNSETIRGIIRDAIAKIDELVKQ